MIVNGKAIKEPEYMKRINKKYEKYKGSFCFYPEGHPNFNHISRSPLHSMRYRTEEWRKLKYPEGYAKGIWE